MTTKEKDCKQGSEDEGGTDLLRSYPKLGFKSIETKKENVSHKQ